MKQNPLIQLSERATGIFLLVIGTITTYFFIISPWLGAINHEAEVSLVDKGIVISPLALVLGGIYTVLGSRASILIGHPQRPTPLGWIFSIILGIAGFLFFLWFKGVLEGYGYQFNR